jgi:protein tyrosine phosphatase
MTMGTKSVIPTWLTSAQSPLHITSALATLALRERSRAKARKSHRHPEISLSDPNVDPYSVSVAYQPENQRHNRYSNVAPYDRTRVVVESEEGGRYLNASWVRERFGGKWWIASQAPLPNAHAFLSLIVQPVTRPPPNLQSSPLTSRTSRIRTVVQLTQNVEDGVQKADIYFPSLEGQSLVISPEKGCHLPPLKTSLLRTRLIKEARCIQSTVSIIPVSSSHSATEAITFQHLLYTAWPDHGVPEPDDHSSLLTFLRLVDATNKDISLAGDGGLDVTPDPPIIVGCSAGIGRTGSFLAMSSLLRVHGVISSSLSPLDAPTPSLLNPLPPSPLGPLPDKFKDDMVVQEVDSLREQRPGMVQREEQVLLIYDILAVFLEN